MDETTRKYISHLPQPLSKVKLVIVLTLLDSGNQFPRGWVEGSKLLYLTNQKNFDLHVTGLRDELGCDIETEFIGGERCYRLRSPDKVKTKPKATLEETQKEALLVHADNSCQVCGAKLVPGLKDLHTDLKVPAERGGNKEFSNWQVICNDCVVNKRRSCNQCGDDCSECSWAFPERVDGLTLIRLPTKLSQKLKDAGINQQSDLEKHIINLLELSFVVEEPEGAETPEKQRIINNYSVD